MTPIALTRNSDHRKSALALILGSAGGIFTMAIHPTAATTNFALLAPVAHSLALVSVMLFFLGAIGLTRYLNAPNRLAFTALVTFGLAIVAIFIAASVSGFIAPSLYGLMNRDVPAAAPTWRIVIAAIFQFNQAMSRIYSVATAVAITLWSTASLRGGLLSRGFAIYGVISAPLIAVLILVGHIKFDVHGMTAVLLTQVIWFVGIALSLRRQPSPEKT